MDSQFVWFELASDDTSKARRFYEDLFGWKANEAGGYTMIEVAAAKDIGAGIKPNPGTGDVPSHWAPFVSVADVRAATEKAGKLGAKIVHEAHETPNGIVSTVLDPTGAAVNLWQALPEG
jgi:predicted enzyme related to lactoylglutathione lyase